MQLEEFKELRNQVRAEENPAWKNEKDRNQVRPKEGPRIPKFTKYTPLNTSWSLILEETLSTKLIPTMRKTPSLPNIDQSKDCWYHHNYDNNTEECLTLKDKIEELIQVGHL